MNPSAGPIAIVLALAAASAAFWTAWPRPAERPGPERAVLERRVAELERLVARPAGEPLIPFDQALVVIGRPVLQDLLDAAMPYETQVAGRFRVRIDSARVACEEGLALVRLDGRASFADRPEDEAFAAATMYGALREFDLVRDEGVLRGRVDVVAFQVHHVEVGDRPRPALRGLLDDLAALRLEAFAGFDYAFDVPVRVVHEMVLPELRLRQGLRIAEARVPLHAQVTNVTALSDRLWISIRLRDPAAADSAALAMAER